MEIEFPSERVIEDFVCQSLEQDWECPVTGEGVSDHIRQHKIPGYGVADVIKINADGGGVSLTVLELKNTPLCADNLCQLARYMVGLKRQAERYERHLNIDVGVYGELAGPIKNPGDWVYLLNNLNFGISVYMLWLDMERGFQSKRIGDGWYNKNEDLSGGKKIARLCYDAYRLDLDTREAFEQIENVVETGGQGGKG